MKKEQKQAAETEILELPVVQYAWLKSEEIPFSEKVRHICQSECSRYAASWSCPPGVGSVEACEARCHSYQEAFVFSTIAEVADAENMEEVLKTRGEHERISRRICEIFRTYSTHVMELSAESCARCTDCTYPDAPCRFPDQMVPCMEGYGIIVALLAEKTGVEFQNGANVVTWFGMILCD